MINLNINEKTVEPKLNFEFYKHLVGSDRSKRNDNFDEFMNGLINEDPDFLIQFYRAISLGKLTDDDIDDQLEKAGAYDDIAKEVDSDIKAMGETGFLRLKMEKWLQSNDSNMKDTKKALQIASNEGMSKEDKMEAQMLVEKGDEIAKKGKNRLKKNGVPIMQ